MHDLCCTGEVPNTCVSKTLSLWISFSSLEIWLSGGCPTFFISNCSTHEPSYSSALYQNPDMRTTTESLYRGGYPIEKKLYWKTTVAGMVCGWSIQLSFFIVVGPSILAMGDIQTRILKLLAQVCTSLLATSDGEHPNKEMTSGIHTHLYADCSMVYSMGEDTWASMEPSPRQKYDLSTCCCLLFMSQSSVFRVC